MIMFIITFKGPVPVFCLWPRRVWLKYVNLQFRSSALILFYIHTRARKWHVTLTKLCYKTQAVSCLCQTEPTAARFYPAYSPFYFTTPHTFIPLDFPSKFLNVYLISSMNTACPANQN